MPILYNPNENALAVRHGGEWILKPVCSDGSASGFENALAVRAGNAWTLLPAAEAQAGENAVGVRAGAETVIVPVPCPPDEEDGCTGDDPLCPACGCEAELASSYLVTMSGFPNLYTLDTFNGAWTVTWQSDCTWYYDITASHRVALVASPTAEWRVTWSVNSPGGASGAFSGDTGANCDPAASDWSYLSCTEPYPVFWPVCPTVQSNVTVVVS